MRLSELRNDFNIYNDGEFLNLIKLDEMIEKNFNLIFVENKIDKNLLMKKKISCVICYESDSEYYKKMNIGVVISSNPKEDFFRIMNFLSEKTRFYYTGEKNEISLTSKIGNHVYLDKTDIIIEDGVIIESGSIIKQGVIIKKNAYIGPNTIVGAESFSYFGKKKEKVKSSKKIIIGENVHLLGGNIIEKGVHRNTEIGKNSKLAVGVIIEHDTIIEKETMICAGAVIAGRVIIGKNSYIGPNSTIRNNIILGEKTIVSIGSVVTKSTKGKERITGNFAISHDKFIENLKAK